MTATAETTYVQAQSESATTLSTVVELVRRIMHADVASILGFSLIDETVTWKAASGFLSPDIDYRGPVRRPLAVEFARKALAENTVVIFEGIGQTPNLPAESFPTHVAEGVRDLAVAPLRINGTRSGALTAGYREPHRFTDEEKKLLQGLAEMASLAMDNAHL